MNAPSLALLIIIISTSLNLYSQHSPCLDTSFYELYISDEFDGDKIDASQWYTFHPHWYWDSVNNRELGDDHAEHTRLFFGFEDATAVFNQVYMDSNVVVSNGTCKLKTYKQKASWMGHERGYTSGMIHSKTQIGGPGMYEMRAKVSGAYLHTYSFWLFGNNSVDKKPISSEIDIFEYFNRKPNSVESNLHFWDTNKDVANKHFERKINQEEWHVYRCVFDTFAVRMYIDDLETPWCIFYAYHDSLTSRDITYADCGSTPRERWVANKYFPYDYHKLLIIITGGTSRTPKMIKRKQWQNEKTADIGEMEIDYFRYYKLRN